jgi:hypothetical protein
VFARQELARLPNGAWASRDEGEGDDVFAITAALGRRSADAAQAADAPLHIVRTTIYIGRAAWADFLQLTRVARSATRIAAVRGVPPAAALAGIARLALGAAP